MGAAKVCMSVRLSTGGAAAYPESAYLFNFGIQLFLYLKPHTYFQTLMMHILMYTILSCMCTELPFSICMPGAREMARQLKARLTTQTAEI